MAASYRESSKVRVLLLAAHQTLADFPEFRPLMGQF